MHVISIRGSSGSELDSSGSESPAAGVSAVAATPGHARPQGPAVAEPTNVAVAKAAPATTSGPAGALDGQIGKALALRSTYWVAETVFVPWQLVGVHPHNRAGESANVGGQEAAGAPGCSRLLRSASAAVAAGMSSSPVPQWQREGLAHDLGPLATALSEVADDFAAVATELAGMARDAREDGRFEEDFIRFAGAFVGEWRQFRAVHPSTRALTERAPLPRPQAAAPAYRTAVAAHRPALWECRRCNTEWPWHVHHCEHCNSLELVFVPAKKSKNAP